MDFERLLKKPLAIVPNLTLQASLLMRNFFAYARRAIFALALIASTVRFSGELISNAGYIRPNKYT
jgi:hypothetical protein